MPESEGNEEYRTVQQQPPGTIGSVMPESIKMDLKKVRWGGMDWIDLAQVMPESIKMDFQEVGWGGMDWIDLAQDRAECWALVNAVVILRV